MEAAAKIAAEVLELDSAAAVRQYVAERLPVVEKEKRI
jgi:hypothetical protein